MAVNARVAARANEWRALDVWIRVARAELPSQAKVNRIQDMSLPAESHGEVIWLDVAVQEAFGVGILDSRDGLVGYEQDRFQRESSTAVVEQVLE